MGSDQQGRYQEFPSRGGDQTSSFLDILLEFLQPHLSPENLCGSNKDGLTHHSCRESHSLITTTSCMWSQLQHTGGSVFILQSCKRVPMVHLTCSECGCSVSIFVITHHHRIQHLPLSTTDLLLCKLHNWLRSTGATFGRIISYSHVDTQPLHLQHQSIWLLVITLLSAQHAYFQYSSAKNKVNHCQPHTNQGCRQVCKSWGGGGWDVVKCSCKYSVILKSC